ncbi:MAG TPA: alpha-glucuronidase family glycosyl hydrolase, partial [Balneolales bacterium]|nr:alpha-glucuronidase family glycosyl hydrolase [Balneolales bacterium]
MKKRIFHCFIFITFLLISFRAKAGDGYRLWLRYDLIQNPQLLKEYRLEVHEVLIDTTSPTLSAAKKELQRGLDGLLGQNTRLVNNLTTDGTLIIGTPKSSSVIASMNLGDALTKVGDQGYIIRTASVSHKHCIVV